jgi:hypothetical protein
MCITSYSRTHSRSVASTYNRVTVPQSLQRSAYSGSSAVPDRAFSDRYVSAIGSDGLNCLGCKRVICLCEPHNGQG